MAKKVPALVDTGACCPPPLLILKHYWDTVAPGCPLRSVPASLASMRGVSGKPMPFVGGGVSLLLRLSGGSLSKQGDQSSPPCHRWYPVQAMVVEHIDSGFILTASFTRKHHMQISFESPNPYILFEEKKFPFFRNIQLKTSTDNFHCPPGSLWGGGNHPHP